MQKQAVIDVSQLYETGNKKFFAAELKADGTYGIKEYYESLMEVKIDFKQDVTNISADDISDYISLASPMEGEGTVKFAVLPYTIYSKFFDVSQDSNNAFVISGSGRVKKVAFGFYVTLGDGSESMFTLYRATFTMPSLSTASYDGKTIRDLTLNVTTSAMDYVDTNGINQKCTYTIINSEINKDIWQKVQKDIYVPFATLPTAP